MSLSSVVYVDSSLSVPATAAPALPTIQPGRPSRPRAMAAALRRMADAAGYNRGGYDSAATNRLNRDWLTQHFSGDAAIGAAWDLLTQRARDLVRNEPWATQGKERIQQNVVGPEGIVAEAEVEFDDETLDDETNRQINLWCDRWADQADAEAESHLAELQSMAVGEMVEAGESYLVKVAIPDSARVLPLAYQVLESEQLNISLDRPASRGAGGRNRIKRGIEFDKFGRKVAYHFWSEHPYDLEISSRDTIRVPAERVIHLYSRRRPSQTRGVTWFAPVLQTLRDLSQYIGDEMTAARIAAAFTVVIKRDNPGTSGIGIGDENGNLGDENGDPLEYLSPGLIANLATGEEIETINPGRPNSQAKPWIELILTALANGIGLTYLGLTGDPTKASFSSARYAGLHDKKFWRSIQGRVGRTLVLPMRREVVSQLVAYGRIPDLTPTVFRAHPYRWLATRLLPPGWEEVDARAEVEAAISRIQAGLSSLQEECAGRGRNWRRILKQRAREVELAKSLGLSLTVDGSVPSPPAAAGQVNLDEADEPKPTDEEEVVEEET
jgi:lambda family phage portal protein